MNKQKQKTKQNRLVKKNMLYYHQNRTFDIIKGHLLCLNKILRYPFTGSAESLNSSYYIISDETDINLSEILNELLSVLKIFGYIDITVINISSTISLMCFNLTEQQVNLESIRYNKYYGYISPCTKIIELRSKIAFDNKEILTTTHLKCIKKILKSLPLKSPINYFIPYNKNEEGFNEVPSLVGDLTETNRFVEKLEKFGYTITIEEIELGKIIKIFL